MKISYRKSKCRQWTSTRFESKAILTNLLSTSRTAVLRSTDILTLLRSPSIFHESNLEEYIISFSPYDCVKPNDTTAAAIIQKQTDAIAKVLLFNHESNIPWSCKFTGIFTILPHTKTQAFPLQITFTARYHNSMVATGNWDKLAGTRSKIDWVLYPTYERGIGINFYKPAMLGPSPNFFNS